MTRVKESAISTMITGVGAVGAHVAAKLQEIGEELVLYDLDPKVDFLATLFAVDRAPLIVGDVNDIERLTHTIRTYGVTRIVHLAALLTRGLAGRPYAGVELNMVGTASVLEAARLTGVKRVVFASTRGVNQLAMPGQPDGKLDEDFVMRVLTDRPRTMYELSKLTGEYLGLLYSDLYGVGFVALRLGGGFGPTPGSPSGISGNVLRPLVYGAALNGRVVIDDPALTYSGTHEFIYFKDDADAFAKACFAPEPKKRVYTIRMHRTYTYAEVVDVVRHTFPDASVDVRATTEASLSPGRAPRDEVSDTTAARDELGWEPKYDLASGIRDWADWIVRTDLATRRWNGTQDG